MKKNKKLSTEELTLVAMTPELAKHVPARTDVVSQIMAYECGEMNETEMVEFFQTLIDSGTVWYLQGHYGRTAVELINAGLCHK